MMSLSFYSAPLPTAKEMQHWDAQAVEYGLPECVLMENAAREALAVLVEQTGSVSEKSILLFMGSGNNGGDAACLARHLLDLNARPLVLHTKALNAYKGVTKTHLRAARKCGVPFHYIGTTAWQKKLPPHVHTSSIVIDGLLGTGFKGELRQNFAEYIHFINSLGKQAFILALDIPSGCSALTGLPLPTSENLAVQAHATVCFAAAKPGLVLPESRFFTGKLFVRSIGMPRVVQEENPPSYGLIQPKRLGTILQNAQHKSHINTHKFSWGHVLVLGGAQSRTGVDLCGAAHLTALAALRTGAGLVTAAAPADFCPAIKNGNANIMTLSLPHEKEPAQWPSSLPSALEEILPRVSCLAIGPGMAAHDNSRDFLTALLSYSKNKGRPRAVLDAGALTVLSIFPELQKFIREDDIITPHPGEAARLLGCTPVDIQADRFTAMRKLTELLPCVCLLKGAGTLISKGNGPIYILPYNITALAIAGSGDVLTGCIAALSGRIQTDSLTLTALGAALHATAGQHAQKNFPQRGHLASDLAHILPQAMEQLSQTARNSLHAETYNLDLI